MKTLLTIAISLAIAIPVASTSSTAMAAGKDAQQRSQRGQLVHDIVMKWGAHVQEAYKTDVDVWAGAMGSVFSKASIGTLQNAINASTFDAMNNAFLAGAGVNAPAAPGKLAAGKVTANLLGDAAADLVFVPITPCRIFDTRLAGGAITGGATRDFDITAVSDYSFQGGAASDCGGMGNAGSFAAVAVNLTSVAPAATGYLTAYPYLTTQPVAATQIYQGGGVLTSLAIVKLDQGPSASEMTVFAERTLHLVGDAIGYYIAPQATALQCQDTANTTISVAAGATSNVVAPACPSGYTMTATNCEAGSWQMPFVYQHGGTCSAQNNGASATDLRASRTCCRVPGR